MSERSSLRRSSSEPLRIDREGLYASGWIMGAKGHKRRMNPPTIHCVLTDSDEEPETVWYAAYDEGAAWKAERGLEEA